MVYLKLLMVSTVELSFHLSDQYKAERLQGQTMDEEQDAEVTDVVTLSDETKARTQSTDDTIPDNKGKHQHPKLAKHFLIHYGHRYIHRCIII